MKADLHQKSQLRLAWALLPLALAVVGCETAAARTESKAIAVVDTGTSPLRSFAPSELQIAGSVDLDPRGASCAQCHPGIAAEWESSSHAFSSFNNPVYAASIDRLRSDVGFGASRVCAGCHDPVLLVSGGMDEAVAPEDPRAHAGITCLTCHSVEQSAGLGNASHVLSSGDPLRPSLNDETSIQAHRRVMARPALREVELCGDCHRSFLGQPTGNPTHLTGMDDLTAWQRSSYAGTHTTRIEPDALLVHADPGLRTKPSPRLVAGSGSRREAERSCASCHMPKRRATSGVQHGQQIASHRFAGAHTWLADMLGDAELFGDSVRQLQSAIQLDVVLAEAGSLAWLAPTLVESSLDEPLVFHVAVENTGVGHRFPGGTRDIADVWLEVTLRDAQGQLLASSLPVESWPDPSVHSLLSAPADERGQLVLDHRTHAFRAPVVDTTIAPQSVHLVRYSLEASELPKTARLPPALPWRLTVSAQHRSRNPAMQAAACTSSKSQRAQRLRTRTLELLARRGHIASLKPRETLLDPCQPQPITVLARTSVDLHTAGTGLTLSTDNASQPTAKLRRNAEDVARDRSRLQRVLRYVHGLERELPEQLHAGLAKLGSVPQQALRSVVLTDSERAEWALSLAKLYAAQGRTQTALLLLGEARQLVGPRAALSAAEGNALASVWRFAEATTAFRTAVAQAPRDSQLWRGLSHSLSSTGDPAGSLAAARRGLALKPHDADLLLLDAKSQQALARNAPSSQAAIDQYLAHRNPDSAPQLAATCRSESEWCRLEQLPVHEHPLRIHTQER